MNISNSSILTLTYIGKMCCTQSLSCVQLFVTPRTAARQATLSRQEYWTGLPSSPPGDRPNSGIEPASLMFTCIGRRVLYHQCYLGSPNTFQIHPLLPMAKFHSFLLWNSIPFYLYIYTHTHTHTYIYTPYLFYLFIHCVFCFVI